MATLSDEATDLLKQLIPMVQGIDKRLDQLETRMTAIEGRMTVLEVGMAELRGRVSQIPTWWQVLTMIAGLVLAVFFGAFGLIKAVAP